REVILRDALAAMQREYEFVFIDCPPSLGLLTVNALTAAGEVLVPLQPHFLGLQGVGRLFETVALVHDRLNPKLVVTGVLLCLYEAGTRLAAEVVDDLRQFIEKARGTGVPWSEARIFDTVIRRNIKLAECPSHGLTIFDYEPRSHGAADYSRLAQEVLGELEAADQPSTPSTTEPAAAPAVDARTIPDDEPAPAASAAHGPVNDAEAIANLA
ncbi:MAG: ParA family protein, partial [Planctomycetota bacterium]